MKTMYNQCFVCGKDNPDGLQLKFKYPENHAMAQVNLPEKFAGYPGVIHGGIVSAILDEAMAKVVLHYHGEAVTGRMQLEFKKYVKPGMDYLVSGRIDKETSRLLYCSSRLVDLEGNVYAKAEAVFLRVKGNE